MKDNCVLIIGEVFVDTHLDIDLENGPLVRLGGIFHSARGNSAINCKFILGYYAPEYLDSDIEYWANKLSSIKNIKLGNINRSPNVMLISESKELSYQGYINILSDQAIFNEVSNIDKIIDEFHPTDVLIYPGRYNIDSVLKSLQNFNGRVHIDLQYDGIEIPYKINREIESIIISTSSVFFRNVCNSSFETFHDAFKDKKIRKFLIKENRGGAECIDLINKKNYHSKFYYVPTMHSVGVGDVYNSIFVSSLFDDNLQKKMSFASHCAARYAETFDFDKFKNNVEIIMNNFDDFFNIRGIRLSWSDRKRINIYIAAPDFPEVDKTLIDSLVDVLNYHNFNPRLPIRENGLFTPDLSLDEELVLYSKDLELLKECNLLIAVMIYNDPGTLVEIGMFKQMEKPVILFDPHNYCDNMFARNSADLVCKNIEEVLNFVFKYFGGK